MKKIKSVLITGGAGFIGANLTRKLLAEKYEVHLLIQKSTDLWRLKSITAKIHLAPIELHNLSQLTKTVKKIQPTAIFHLAAYGGSSSQTDMQKIIDTNIQGTANLLLAAKEIPYTLFVNTGSSSEYGFKAKPMKENDSLEPASFYAATKAGSTYLCQVFAREYNKPIVTIRPFSVYGPYEAKNRFIATIVRSLITNQPIYLTPGTTRHDFIYIDDIIDAYMAAIKNAHRISGKVINIGTGNEYTNDEVVKALFALTKKHVPVAKGKYPSRGWDTPHWRANIFLAKKLLGWTPHYTLKQGLRQTYNWYNENLILYH